MKRLHTLSLTTMLLFFTLLSGCAVNAPVSVKPKEPTFDYTPPTAYPSGSSDMNIILVNPKFAEEFKYSRQKTYSLFARRMKNDFEEVLTSLGYTVQGPYNSYDELVFSVKEQGDLILQTEIDINQNPSFSYQDATPFLALMVNQNPQKIYSISGSVTLAGQITLKALEPITKEKLWVKTVPIKQRVVPVNSSRAWTSKQINSGAIYNDVGIQNSLSDALSDIYKDSLRQTHTYLNPKELQLLRPQIKRIKDKVRY